MPHGLRPTAVIFFYMTESIDSKSAENLPCEVFAWSACHKQIMQQTFFIVNLISHFTQGSQEVIQGIISRHLFVFVDVVHMLNGDDRRS